MTGRSCASTLTASLKGLAHHRRIGRDGDMILALHLLTQGFDGEFIENVDI